MPRLCAPVLSLCLLLACGDSPSQPSTSLPFTTLSASKVPGSSGPQIQTVVRSEVAWEQTWSELWQGHAPLLPFVDFSRDMVALVTGSEICFGNAEIEVIVHTGTEIRIRYADAAPSLCLCAQAELSFHAVRTPRAVGEARFEPRQTPPLCPSSP